MNYVVINSPALLAFFALVVCHLLRMFVDHKHTNTRPQQCLFLCCTVNVSVCVSISVFVTRLQKNTKSFSSLPGDKMIVLGSHCDKIIITAVPQVSTSGCLQRHKKPHTHPFKKINDSNSCLLSRWVDYVLVAN